MNIIIRCNVGLKPYLRRERERERERERISSLNGKADVKFGFKIE